MTNVMGSTVRGTFIQEDTTVLKYRGVIHGTDDQEVVAGVSTTAPFIGVTDESAEETTGVAGDPVGVIMLGVAKMVIASASTKGGAITGTTAGKGLVTTTKGNYCVGWLLETTTASNQVAKVLVAPFLYPATA